MLSYGYAVSIGDQLEPYGVLNPAAYQLIGKVFHQLKEREAWARPSKALVEAALVTSEPIPYEHQIPESDFLGPFSCWKNWRCNLTWWIWRRRWISIP